MLKCTKVDFPLRFTALPDSLAGFKWPTSNGREARKDGKKGQEMREQGRRGRRKGEATSEVPSVPPVPNLTPLKTNTLEIKCWLWYCK